MPIKGLAERRRLPRVGKIHLGIIVEGEKRPFPKAVDYFVVRADDTTPEASAKAFQEVYGDKPTELDIIFPTDDPEQWADPWYRAYSQSWGLLCKGDGEWANAKWDLAAKTARPPGVEEGSWASGKTESWTHLKIPCLGAECPMQKAKVPRCKAVMNLQFLLPLVRGIGVWQIDTGSWNSIRNINESVELVKLATGGRVRGLTLKMRLKPLQVTPAGGEVKTKTVHVLDISMPDITLPELLAQAAALPERALQALPAPTEDEAPDDEELPSDLYAAADPQPAPQPAAQAAAPAATAPAPATSEGKPSTPPPEAPEPTQGEMPGSSLEAALEARDSEEPAPAEEPDIPEGVLNSLQLHLRKVKNPHDRTKCETCIEGGLG